jgi:hypothetical protein
VSGFASLIIRALLSQMRTEFKKSAMEKEE